jgi:hypothetical protein
MAVIGLAFITLLILELSFGNAVDNCSCFFCEETEKPIQIERARVERIFQCGACPNSWTVDINANYDTICDECGFDNQGRIAS